MKLDQLVEVYGLQWQPFKDAMEEMDKEAFHDLIERAKRHAEAGLKTVYPNLFNRSSCQSLSNINENFKSCRGSCCKIRQKPVRGAAELHR